MIIVHSGEPRNTEQQLRDEIEVLEAKLYNAELQAGNTICKECCGEPNKSMKEGNTSN